MLRSGALFRVAPIVSVDGDTAHVTAHVIMSHWLSPASEHSTWFYGEVEVDLRRGEVGWQITRYSPEWLRVEGYLPPVNHLSPDLAVR